MVLLLPFWLSSRRDLLLPFVVGVASAFAFLSVIPSGNLLLLVPLPFFLSFPLGICFCICLCLSFCHSLWESASACAFAFLSVIPSENLLLLVPLPFFLSFPLGICFCLCLCLSFCHSLWESASYFCVRAKSRHPRAKRRTPVFAFASLAVIPSAARNLLLDRAASARSYVCLAEYPALP